MKLCFYGKATGLREWVYIRKTNGMVALTPSKQDPWWMKIKIWKMKTPKPDYPFTTFIKPLWGRKTKTTFG